MLWWNFSILDKKIFAGEKHVESTYTEVYDL